MSIMDAQAGGAIRPAETAESDNELDMRELFAFLFSKWKQIIAIALLGAIAAGVIFYLVITPAYQATCKLYINSNSSTVVDLSALQLSSSLAQDYRELFKNHTVHDQVKEALGLDYEYRELEKMIQISNPTDTHILYISVSSPDPQEAVNMANTYGTVVRQFIKERLDSRMPSVFEEAMLPNRPSSPQRALGVVLGGLLGGIIGCVIYLVCFITDDRITSAEYAERKAGLRVLGVMPTGKAVRRKH